MSWCLVGSEMCIRDRIKRTWINYLTSWKGLLCGIHGYSQ
jgi:hypothetical protein